MRCVLSSESDNTVEKLYHLWVIRGMGYERLTAYPMSQRQCLAMKSKHNRRSQAGIMLYEVGQTPPNSDHDYAWLDEMGERMLARENAATVDTYNACI